MPDLFVIGYGLDFAGRYRNLHGLWGADGLALAAEPDLHVMELYARPNPDGATGRVPRVVEMELIGVRVELPTSTPIALLRERTGDQRVLPIFIGGAEATAIAFALEDVVTPGR